MQAPVEQRYGRPVSEPEPATEARRIATEARDRARFEEEALALADQVYRVARRLVGSREEAEDLVQETYARAFRSWRSFTPGTNMRAWLLRILTNLNVDRGRRVQRTPQIQPLEETDYYLANKVASAAGEDALEQEQVVERLSQDSVVTRSRRSRRSSARSSCSSTSATSRMRTPRRSSTSRSGRSCPASIAAGAR